MSITTQTLQGFSRSQVAAVAAEAAQVLKDVTTQLYTAGSYRRGNTRCKDLELVVAPIEHRVRLQELFGQQEYTERHRDFALKVRRLGEIMKGDPQDGRYVAIHHTSGIVIDLFMPQPHDFFRALAIRTGPEDYSHHTLAYRWSHQGWFGTRDGLRRRSEYVRYGSTYRCIVDTPTLPPEWHSEEEFYEWLGLRYIVPELRGKV